MKRGLMAEEVRQKQRMRLQTDSSKLLDEVNECIEIKMNNSEETQVFFYKALTPFVRADLAERGFKVNETTDRDGILVTISWE